MTITGEERFSEAAARWGDTKEFQESVRRTSKYSAADFQAAKVDQEAVTEGFAQAFGNRVEVNSPEVAALVAEHRAAISKWFYECSIEMQRNLALMYVSDERFKAYYDGRARGLAEYVHNAILANTK